MRFWKLAHIDNPFDPTNRFETSYILSPWLLACYRLLIAFYSFFTIFFRYGYKPKDIGESFSYFTDITFWGIAFYFLFAAYHTTQHARTGQAPLQKWGKLLQFLHSLLYTTIVTFPFLVTVVYWAVLAPPGWFDTTYEAWSNVSVHALNAVFAILEIILTRTKPMPWIHIPFLVVFLACYLGVAYITKATQGFYTYSFLNPNKDGAGITAAYIVGIAVGACIVFAIVWGVLWLKVRLFEKKGRRDGERYQYQLGKKSEGGFGPEQAV